MFKLRVFIEKSISSLQIGFNVKFKDSKYKTSEPGFLKCPLFRQLTTKVLRTGKRSNQGPEVYI